MFNRLRKLCGRYMRALLPRKLYKLIANGAIIVPAYYKDIIADAETNFDLSSTYKCNFLGADNKQ